jgi:hypothetical protein
VQMPGFQPPSPTTVTSKPPLPDVVGHRADGADRFARRPGGLPTIG